MSPEMCEEYAALYALGLLEGAERRSFEEELAKNPVAGAMVAEFERSSSLLVTTLPKIPAPATLRAAVLQGVQSQMPVAEPPKKFTFSPIWIPWGVAAALAIICAVSLAGKSRTTDSAKRLQEDNNSLQIRIAGLQAERDRLEAKVNSLESEKKSLETRMASLQPKPQATPLDVIQTVKLAPQGLAKPETEVIASWDSERQQGLLNLSRLPLPPADKSYQLWIITPDSPQPVDVGVIISDTARYEFRSPYPTKVAALAISLEPKGGSPAPTNVLYVGKF